ncbi:class IV adenylate cyclase [Candidatus Dojkabacteria bacterium]|nr:class IV adenylate cyclase [Candidatus Dojkabacteria bacterium]
MEIELKYIVDDRDTFEKWLVKNAKKKGDLHQIDEYFVPENDNWFEQKYADKYLRIRRTAEQGSITFKLWHQGKEEGKFTHCDEYETGIVDTDQMGMILKSLGLGTLCIVDKKRAKYMFEDYEIVIDEVKDLGLFCEIEFKGEVGEDANVMRIRQEIKALGASIPGLKVPEKNDPIQYGYVYALLR